jgi:acyl-CoA oxidase
VHVLDTVFDLIIGSFAAIHRFNAAKLHCINYIYNRFMGAVDKAPVGLRAVLAQLCSLYALNSVSEQAGWFLQFGYFRPEHLTRIQARVLELLEELRPQAVALTDAFGYTDYVINSPLGCSDGDIYRRIFERTVQANPPTKPHAYFERVIKPALFRQDPVSEVIELENDK